MRVTLLCTLVLSVLACRGEMPPQERVERSVPIVQPNYQPAFAPRPAEEPVEPVEAAQEADDGAECEAERITTVRKLDARRYEVTASIRSRVSLPLTLTLRSVCPNGVAHFDGLPAGYDYFNTCNAGPCASPHVETQKTLEPGGALVIDRVTVQVRGSTCQAELTERRYDLRFDAEIEGVALCEGEHAQLDIGPTPMPARPLVRAPKPPPKPSPAMPQRAVE